MIRGRGRFVGAWHLREEPVDTGATHDIMSDVPRIPESADPPAAVPPGSPVPALEALRCEIDALDHRIVELLAERQRAVQRAVAIKRAAGLPIYHPAREENLISLRREQARQEGLDPNYVEELYRCIVRQSRMRQTVHAAKTGVCPGYRVVMVGGAGQMGRYFARWFGDAGYDVVVLEADDWPRAAEMVRGARLVLVSVPIHVTEPVIRQLGAILPSDCVLADITSVKRGPVAAMLAAHGGPVIGLHPLFGPNTTVMDQQIMVACPGRDPVACQWVLDQCAAWGNIVMTLDAAEHDAVMDVVQGVRHFATFAFGRFLAQRQLNLGPTLECSSPIYRLEMGMVGRMFAQDPELYADIIFASPERRRLLGEFIDSLAAARSMAEGGDAQAFCQEFRSIAEWFGPFCEQAMRESSFLIDKLVERF